MRSVEAAQDIDMIGQAGKFAGEICVSAAWDPAIDEGIEQP
jgi:hypothetical protein